LRWSYFLFGLLMAALSQGAHAADMQDRYQRQSLSVVGAVGYAIVQNQRILTALDFARITRQPHIVRQIQAQRAGHIVGGVLLAGAGGILGLTGLYGLLLSASFGQATGIAISLGVLGLSAAALYGSVHLFRIRIPPGQFWTRSEAEHNTRVYNRALLQSRRFRAPRPAVDFGLALNGLVLRGQF
jgi:hypothetical protein